MKLFVVLLLISVPLALGSRFTHNSRETEVLNDLREKNISGLFDQRPRSAGPLRINISMVIKAIEYDPENAFPHMSLTFVYRESWVDDRLKYNKPTGIEFVNLVLSDELHIWRPDTYFVNEHDANPLESGLWDNVYRLYPNGTVLFSVKLKHDFTCPANLWKYPFDWTSCKVQISSFTSNRNNLKFQWAKTNPVRKAASFPEQIGDYFVVAMPTYDKFNQNEEANDVMDQSAGDPYSMVTLDIILGRRIHYIVEIILAPAGFVVLSLIVFANPKWLTQGPPIIIGLFIGLLVFNAGIYTAFPLARHSWIIHYLTGLGSILFSEACVIAVINLIANCIWRGSPQSQRDLEMNFSYSPFSGVDSSTDDLRPLEPPKSSDDSRKQQILDKLRFVLLAVYIFVFVVFIFVFFNQS